MLQYGEQLLPGRGEFRLALYIEHRHLGSGIFYVRYVDSSQASKSKGLFSWLTSDSSAADAKKQAPSDRFQFRLKTENAGTQVTVLDVKGEPELSTTGQQLLDVLQQQLR